MHTLSIKELHSDMRNQLQSVQSGEEIVITKHGNPIAKLIPYDAKKVVEESIKKLLHSRKGCKLGDIDLKQSIEEGRE